MAIASAIAAAVAGAVVSGGIAAATAPGMPKPPNLAASTAAGIQANALVLPEERQLQAAAKLGIPTTYATGNQLPIYKNVPLVGPDGNIIYRQIQVGTQPEIKTADFTGLGDADVQSSIAKKLAASGLQLQQQYGPQFVQEALKEEQIADPQGTAARQQLAQLIQKDAANAQNVNRPVATLLENQLNDQLTKGTKLTNDSANTVAGAVQSGGAARGGADETAGNVQSALEQGQAGQARLAQRQQNALSFLTSGATPEDVAYRRQQQVLGNEGAFLSGQTPEAQFSNLSGAQQGAAPNIQGQPLPNINPNAGAAGVNYNMNNYNAQLGYAATQANPWITGLSLGLKGLGTAGAAGYKPFGQ